MIVMGFKNGMRPVHPGEILREDFMVPAGLSANALAKALHVPAPRVNDIVRQRRGITADTAMRLARYFGGDARSWLNLQVSYDLRVAEIANAKRVEREIVPMAHKEVAGLRTPKVIPRTKRATATGEPGGSVQLSCEADTAGRR
jgi:addiction module HigA family antidote